MTPTRSGGAAMRADVSRYPWSLNADAMSILDCDGRILLCSPWTAVGAHRAKRLYLLRRIVAAVNATCCITTDGLERIGAHEDGPLNLALDASVGPWSGGSGKKGRS